ncbi:MAG: class A beta-lactamase-related serine hydrolase [Cyanosarcina radialis HA8281-LM2]|nr:class A beta-lactamase-related serine hydrolase [Cyanosarcina radialis HA8281-LM2]
MTKKQQPEPGKQNQETAKLEAELHRAHKLVEKLKQKNYQLQSRVSYLENRHSRQPTALMDRIPQSRTKTSPQRQLDAPMKRRRIIKRRATNRFWLRRLALLAIALFVGFAGISFAATLLFNRLASNSGTKPAPTGSLSSPANQNPPNTSSSSNVQTPVDRSTLVYNVTTPPDLKNSEELQAVVDELVALARSKNLPTERLSITLIDAKRGEIAGYQQDELRYPASVVKMFWLVALYAQLENGLVSDSKELQAEVEKMIKNSDNDSAAFVLDRITDTKSQPTLSDEKFKVWLNKRLTVNQFFAKAGYEKININQKAYPVYSINLPTPRGSDLQIRRVPGLPLANQISSYHAARLMYEVCFTKQAVSPAASEKMCQVLTRDLKPEAWKKQAQAGGFHPIYGLLGEAFPNTDLKFASKAGGTSTDRHDAAFVATPDDKTAYVLVVLGDDGSYAGNGSILPQMSRLVFDRLSARN